MPRRRFGGLREDGFVPPPPQTPPPPRTRRSPVARQEQAVGLKFGVPPETFLSIVPRAGEPARVSEQRLGFVSQIPAAVQEFTETRAQAPPPAFRFGGLRSAAFAGFPGGLVEQAQGEPVTIPAATGATGGELRRVLQRFPLSDVGRQLLAATEIMAFPGARGVHGGRVPAMFAVPGRVVVSDTATPGTLLHELAHVAHDALFEGPTTEGGTPFLPRRAQELHPLLTFQRQGFRRGRPSEAFERDVAAFWSTVQGDLLHEALRQRMRAQPHAVWTHAPLPAPGEPPRLADVLINRAETYAELARLSGGDLRNLPRNLRWAYPWLGVGEGPRPALDPGVYGQFIEGGSQLSAIGGR